MPRKMIPGKSMKSFDQKFLMMVLLLVAAIAPISKALSQAPQPSPEKKEAASSTESRPASVLFDEANTYVNKKFKEFNKQKLQYDEKLEAKTKKEQKDLAAKNVAALRSRKSLTGA